MFVDNKNYYDLSNPYSKLWLNLKKEELPRPRQEMRKMKIDIRKYSS